MHGPITTMPLEYEERFRSIPVNHTGVPCRGLVSFLKIRRPSRTDPGEE